MGHLPKSFDETETGVRIRTARLRLGAGATALLLAATIAACGSSDSSSDTSSAASDTTATQADTPAETPADTAGDDIAAASAEEILDAAREASSTATAVHVAGTMQGSTIDFSYVRDKGASGTLTEGADTIDLIQIGDTSYIRANRSFWEQMGDAATAKAVADKWVSAPSTQRGFAALTEIADMQAMLDQVLRPTGAIEKGEPTTLDGADVIPLTSREGTLLIAATGEPLPLKIASDDVAERGDIVFDGWNEPIELRAPDGALDISDVGAAQ
jgi:hypothetical protein